MQLKEACIKYDMNIADALNAFTTGEIKCNRKQKAIQEIVDLYIPIKDKFNTKDAELDANGKTGKDDTVLQLSANLLMTPSTT